MGQKKPAAPKKSALDSNIAIFMDDANDNDLEDLKEVWERHHNKLELLTYHNKKLRATALHLASNNGNSEIVDFLVRKVTAHFPSQAKEIINARNIYGFTPLMSVSFRGFITKGREKYASEDRLRIAKTLVEAGADINIVTSDTKMTSLHWASYNKDAHLVRYLLEKGAMINVFSGMDRLAIDVAGSSQAIQVMDTYLLHFYEKFKDAQMPDSSGNNVPGVMEMGENDSGANAGNDRQ